MKETSTFSQLADGSHMTPPKHTLATLPVGILRSWTLPGLAKPMSSLWEEKVKRKQEVCSSTWLKVLGLLVAGDSASVVRVLCVKCITKQRTIDESLLLLLLHFTCI